MIRCINCTHYIAIPFLEKKFIHLGSRKKRCGAFECECNEPEPKEVENDSKK